MKNKSLLKNPLILRVLLQNSNLKKRLEKLSQINSVNKKSLEELERENQELQNKIAELEQVFAILVHDLKSPLSVIMGFSEILKTDDLPAEKLKLFSGMINTQADNAFTLSNKLIDWFKSTKSCCITEVNLKERVNDITGLLEVNARLKEVTLMNIVPTKLMVNVNTNCLETALRNLISNAIKFTPAGKAVFISAMASNGFVEISVTDSGAGIKPETMEKIFTRLVSTPGTNQEKGSGIGLFICSEMAKKMGGNISVSSTLNRSATFTLTFPSRATK